MPDNSGNGEENEEEREDVFLRQFPLEFSTDVSSSNNTEDNTAKTRREAPFDAEIVEVVIGWPSGANQLVGVSFGTAAGNQILPRNPEDDFIAADDFTHPFRVSEEVGEDTVLQAEFLNNDSNDHFINVFATVKELPPGTLD